MGKTPSQRKLNSLRREWQKRLKLQDWKISIGWVDLAFLKEITGTDNPCGACENFTEAKEAKIWMLKPEEWGEEADARERDYENTIVHELLHCHFAHFTAIGSVETLIQEQLIEALTAAMLELKRQK